ncbi:MAG: dihydropteroate synthase [Bacteroidales bacterium]|nr:dihydropteroate synthase [Bacteroidales bacterium]
MVSEIKIMGIVNVNDDSFFAGSRVSGVEQFIARVEKLFGEGADVVDIGACSSRPGSTYPGVEEEWRRLKPVLEVVQKRFPDTRTMASESEPSISPSPSASTRAAADTLSAGDTYPLPIASTEADVFMQSPEEANQLPTASGYTGSRFSIDTFSAEIVKRAYDIIGPFIVNDISAGQSDPELLPLVARLGLPYVAMHNQIPFVIEGKELHPIADGEGDIVARVAGFFSNFEKRAAEAGLQDWILDPGFGFGKDVDENLELLNRLDGLKIFGREILIGISRKRMTYQPLGLTPSDPKTLGETLRLERLAISRGANWIRCHDIPPRWEQHLTRNIQ